MNAQDVAVFQKLTGSTALTALLSGGTASPSVYHKIAPENTDAPYVVFDTHVPSVPQYTIGGVAFENTVYQVKGIVEGTSALAAGTIAARIDAALTDQALSITGYTHLYCRRIQDIDYFELEGGLRFNHRGGLFRVVADPS